MPLGIDCMDMYFYENIVKMPLAIDCIVTDFCLYVFLCILQMFNSWKSLHTLIARICFFTCMHFQMRHCEKALEHWFHQNVLSNDSFNEKHSENSSNIDDKDMAFHLNVFLNVFSNYHHVKKLLGIEYKNTFLNCMCSHMIFQIIILCKDLWEMITWVWLFTCMYSHMWLQISTFQKSLLTMLARVRFSTCMHSQILCQKNCVKIFGHWLHGYGYSPVCIRKWDFKW